MFGYVRIAKPELKIYQFEQYRALYCGSCDLLGEHSRLARFALSYDMAFLLALELCVNDYKYSILHHKCPFNPLKKVHPIVPEHSTLTADIILTLTKYKLMDTAEDSRLLKAPAKITARLLDRVARAEQTDSRIAELARVCSGTLLTQAKLEARREPSIDAICEPTAQLMQYIFSMLSTGGKNPALERLGYLLGRYVYMCDALDDLFKDERQGRYNVLLMQSLPAERAIALARSSLMATIAEAQLALDLVELYGDLAPIVRNIVELGLIFTADALAQTQLKKYGITAAPTGG